MNAALLEQDIFPNQHDAEVEEDQQVQLEHENGYCVKLIVHAILIFVVMAMVVGPSL